jgi:hypothetical protein
MRNDDGEPRRIFHYYRRDIAAGDEAARNCFLADMAMLEFED